MSTKSDNHSYSINKNINININFIIRMKIDRNFESSGYEINTTKD